MLSGYDEHQYVTEAVRAGARGYVLKTRDAEHLTRAVRLVAEGSMVFDPDVVASLAGELAEADVSQSLSARELEVLQLLAFGHTNTEIAQQLSMSMEDVRSYLEKIYEKLGTSDRTAAVALALRRRLID